MTTGSWTFVVVGTVASLLLTGCGGEPRPPDARSGGSSALLSPDASATTGVDARSGQGSEDGSDPVSIDGDQNPTDADEGGSPGDGTGNGTSREDGGAGLEMPEAPEETVTSLSQLLGPRRTGPLVTAPLPLAANARGRLVTGFPAFLRPTSHSRVRSSGISPSGNRLQVALVASSTMTPDEVLLAYRTRFGLRGLAELAAPPTSSGASAAAFRRGQSVVTVTAVPEGPRTTYSIHATLRAGGA